MMQNGSEIGDIIVLVEYSDFVIELAGEVLHGAELDDLQSLFADEMNVSKVPLG
jgi:hypothetical protein